MVLDEKHLKKENNLESALLIQYLEKLINIFYKNYLNKAKTTLKAIDTTIRLARLIHKQKTKIATRYLNQKRGQLASSSNKLTKKS